MQISYREEILPSDQSQMKEHVTFTYSSLRKLLEKQTKKQVDGFESLRFLTK